MSFLRNLQVKVLLAALIPGSVILILVALIAIYAYVATALEVVEQRDAELARLTAERVGDVVERQTDILRSVAFGLGAESRWAQDLGAFDGGVTVYARDGSPVWSSEEAEPLGGIAAAELESARSSMLPSYSNVFSHARSGRHAVMITVPVVDEAGEFWFAASGVATLGGSPMSAMLSESLDVAPGEDGHAYLVDGSGRAIFHGRAELVAADLTGYPPVSQVSAGVSGSDLSIAPTGERVISGFAPISGAGWGVVVQQPWSEVQGPIRNTSWMVLGLLMLGSALASGGVWLFVGKTLMPIRDLTEGARLIASGRFNHTIEANTGDEVQELAEQFNLMARAIEKSHAELDDRVSRQTESARMAAEENAVMAEIGRIIGSSLDISLVYDHFVDQTRRIIDSDAIAIMNVYPRRGTFTAAYMSGLSMPNRQPGVEYPLDGTATEQAFETGMAVLFQTDSEVEVMRDFPGLMPSWEQGLRSFMAVPLMSHNEVIGILWVGSRSVEAYGARDVGIGERVASQIAGAVANAQLYEEIQQFYEQEQRRAEQFRAIGEVGRRISSIRDVDGLLSSVGQLGTESLGYDRASLGMLEGGELVFSPKYNPHLSARVRRSLQDGHENQGITGLVASTGQPMIVPDIENEPRYRPVEETGNARSCVTVPVTAGGQTVGVLHTQSLRANAFDEADKVVLQALAQEIGIAVENAHLFREQQDRAEFFRQVAELSSKMSSTLDLDEALSQIVQMIQNTFGYYHVGIGLIEGDEVIYKFGSGAPSDNPEFSFDPARLRVGSEGLTGWVARTGEALLVSDVSRDPRYVAMRHLNTRSELTIPIRAKGEVIGVLDLQSDTVGAFSESDLITLQSLANEAGISIENARLFEAERRRNERMAAINAVALNVSAVLTLGELLPHVVQLVRETFGYHTVGVFLVDDDGREAVLEAVDSGDSELPVRGTRMRIGEEGIVGHVAATGLPWITGDASSDPFYSTLALESPATRSELAMPIKQGDLVVGVLDLHSERADAFDDTDMLIAQTLANQLTVAIENARIFDETRDLAVLEERNRMAREIHDTLAQGFTGIVIQLEAGEQAMDRDVSELRGHVSMAKSLARECLAEARRSVWNLLPEALEENPLDVIIEAEVERFNGTSSANASFTLLGARRQLPAVAQAALMRICQESLINIGKYADASEVKVTLDFALDTVTLTVEDDGAGFDPDAVRIEVGRGGFGLIGMRQRARLLRGDVSVTSAPGKGAKVEARIPIA